MKNLHEFYYHPINEDEEDDMIDQELEGTSDESLEGDENLEADMEVDDFPVEEESEVELDVTQLVDKQDQIINQIDSLSGEVKKDDLTSQKIDMLNAKIEQNSKETEAFLAKLEDTIKKRLPTDVEQVQMRSLSSYPFNQSLTDFWFNDQKLKKVEGDDDDMYELRTSDVKNYDRLQIEKSL